MGAARQAVPLPRLADGLDSVPYGKRPHQHSLVVAVALTLSPLECASLRRLCGTGCLSRQLQSSRPWQRQQLRNRAEELLRSAPG